MALTRLFAPLRAPSPRLAYSGYYGAQFLFAGVQMPFLPGYLDASGLSAGQIGGIVATALILRLLIAPVIAFRAETLADPRRASVLASAAMAVAALVTLVAATPGLLIAASVTLLFFFGLHIPLTDAAVLRADRRGALTYGPVRSAGSIAFIAANLIGGLIISATTDTSAVVWMAAAAMLTFVIATRLPPEPAPDTPRRPPELGKALVLFRSRSFLYLLFGSGCVQGAHATYYAFSELSFSAIGYPSWLIGILWTVGVLAEIVFFVRCRSLIERLGPKGLLLCGAIAGVIRWPLMGLSPPLALVFPLQVLHAATFGATYMATIEFTGRAVPEEYRVTAMTIVSSLGIGAMTGIATLLSGQIFDADAPFTAFAAMGALSAVGLVLSILLIRRWDGGMLGAVKAV